MSANIFGERFKFMSFGESHGPAYGVVIDGMPAGINVNTELLTKNLARRRPGQGAHTTGRQETDFPEILSGVYDGKSLGTPIAIIVRNADQRSGDYDEVRLAPRNGHADDVWKSKFGHADHRGGGRSSGRETLNRVIAGSFAQMIFAHAKVNIAVIAGAEQIGPHKLNPRQEIPQSIKDFLSEAKRTGESYGGVASCSIMGAPKNLGQPLFHKLKADLAGAMMGIGAVEGFEFGAGFRGAELRGTKFHEIPESENYGGIRGGISTGEEIKFRLAFKPTSSIMDVAKVGRHDPCIIPRALPVIEAMAWIVLADHWLWSQTDRIGHQPK